MEKISRRTLLKSIFSLSALNLSSCVLYRDAVDYYANDNQFSQFRNALSYQWNNLSKEEKNNTRKVWQTFNEETKKIAISSYSNPNYRFMLLDQGDKEKIIGYLKYQKQTDFILQSYPWIDQDNINRRDLIFLIKKEE